MRLSRFFAFLAALLFLPTLAAYADTDTTLVLDSTYVWESQDYTATGTVTFDTDTGALIAMNLNYGDWNGGNPGGFITGISQSGGSGSPIEIQEAWNLGVGQSDAPVITLVLPVDSLIGYDGGSICTSSNQCNGESSVFTAELQDGDFISGTLSPTPEPSGLALIGAGALAMIGLLGRKATASNQMRS